MKKAKRQQHLEKTVLRDVIATRRRHLTHLPNLLCFKLTKDRLNDISKSRNNYWMLATWWCILHHDNELFPIVVSWFLQPLKKVQQNVCPARERGMALFALEDDGKENKGSRICSPCYGVLVTVEYTGWHGKRKRIRKGGKGAYISMRKKMERACLVTMKAKNGQMESVEC